MKTHTLEDIQSYNEFYKELTEFITDEENGIHSEILKKIAELKFKASLLFNQIWLEDLYKKLENQGEFVDSLLDVDIQIRLRSQKYFGSTDFYHQVTIKAMAETFLINTTTPPSTPESTISNNYVTTLISDTKEEFLHFLDQNRFLVTLFILSQ
jgi:hypothetical protein